MSDNIEILVIEDSRTQGERLKLLLQAQGYQVAVVSDGAAAIAAARTRKPRLVISGIAIPGMDGYQICSAIKHDDTLKDVPVVLLTALADVEDLIRALNAKADYHITKPYQEDFLLSRIAAILSDPVQGAGESDAGPLAVMVRGSRYMVTADHQQLFRLLLCTYENYGTVLHQTRALTTAQLQLKIQNQQLTKDIEKVRAAEERYRALLEKNTEALLVVDRSGVIRAGNAAAAALLDYPPEDLVGRECGFPVVIGDTPQLCISRRDGASISVEIHVGQTEWEQERAYLVSLRETAIYVQGANTGPHSQEETTETNGCRMLVVEDNPVNRTQIVRLLEKQGYQADVATNGLEAVKACSHTSYAIVFMDVEMPVMGGFEATVRIRQHDEAVGIRTPIIAVTAHTLTGDRERCLAAGMDGYLPKPIKPVDLKTALARWLSPSASLTAPPLCRLPKEVLDVEEAMVHVGGDRERLRQMVLTFLTTYPKLLTDIHGALSRQDPETLTYIAFMLKGVLKNFAAKAAFDAACKLEHLGHQRDFLHVTDALAELENSLSCLQPALTRVMEAT